MNLLARASDLPGLIGDSLIDPDVPNRAKAHLIEQLSFLEQKQEERGRIAGLLLQREGLSQRHQDILRVYQMRTGDRDALTVLIDRIETARHDVVTNILASLNSVPDRALGEAVLAKVRLRHDPPSTVPGLAGSALTGLTHVVVSDGWNSYALDEAPRHPAWAAWQPMFDDWIATEGMSVMGRLRLIERMLEIRPDLIPELEAIIFSATDPDGEAWDEDDDGHHLRAGMDELRRRRVVIPLPLATTFATAKRPNLHYAGISAIGAHATREALDLLLVLHRTAN